MLLLPANKREVASPALQNKGNEAPPGLKDGTSWPNVRGDQAEMKGDPGCKGKIRPVQIPTLRLGWACQHCMLLAPVDGSTPDCSRSSTASQASSAASHARALASSLAVRRAPCSRSHPARSAARRPCVAKPDLASWPGRVVLLIPPHYTLLVSGWLWSAMIHSRSPSSKMQQCCHKPAPSVKKPTHLWSCAQQQSSQCP